METNCKNATYDIIAIMIVVVLLAGVISLINVSSMYHFDSTGQVATKGLLLTSGIDLNQYQKIGEEKRLFCLEGGILYTSSAVHETTFVCKK